MAGKGKKKSGADTTRSCCPAGYSAQSGDQNRKWRAEARCYRILSILPCDRKRPAERHRIGCDSFEIERVAVV